MEQIFIKVATFNNEGRFVKKIDKEIEDCTEEERELYYQTMSKNAIVSMLEKYIANSKLKGDR